MHRARKPSAKKENRHTTNLAGFHQLVNRDATSTQNRIRCHVYKPSASASTSNSKAILRSAVDVDIRFVGNPPIIDKWHRCSDTLKQRLCFLHAQLGRGQWYTIDAQEPPQ